MRGNHGEGAGAAEVVHNGNPERAAFLGIGGGAQFIQEHQRVGGHIERHFADVRDVRGKRAEVFLDRLVIANIGQHLLENREFGRGCWYRQCRLRHQAEQTDRLERYRLAAGIGAADEQRAPIAGQFQADGHHGFMAAAQHVIEQRVARVLQRQAVAEAGDDTPEIQGEPGFGEDQFQFRHSDQGLTYGFAVSPQAVRHLQQDAMDLARLILGQAHQFIVQVNGLERLHEQRVAAGTGAVNHAIDLAALSGNHRHHEALVADGDELFLEHAILAMRAQEAVEGFLDGFLLALDVATQAVERHAGVIGHAAIGQDLALELVQKRAKIADGLGAAAQARESLGGSRKVRFGVSRDIQQGKHSEDLFGIEARAFDAQLLDGLLHIRHAAELDADGCALCRRLRACCQPQVRDRFFGLGEILDQARAIGMRL